MSDIETIAYFVNPGEVFSIAVENRLKFAQKDVYYIERLGHPLESRIEYLFKIFAHARKRLIVSGVEDLPGWVSHFDKCGGWMEVDDETIVFDKQEF